VQILTESEPFLAGLVGPTIELKLFDTGTDGLIEGYGATFNSVDLGGDTVAPGAFADSLLQHASKGTTPPMLWHHRIGSPVGKWLAMGEDGRGLRVRGQMNLDTSGGRDAYNHAKAGDSTGLSIGYTVPPGGSTRTKTGRQLTKLNLHEISLTPLPMDEGARITQVKTVATLTSRDELEELLTKTGLPRRAARKIARGGWPALAQDDESADALMAVIRAARLDLSKLKGR
jgi:HK97 family phage prohead protease